MRAAVCGLVLAAGCALAGRGAAVDRAALLGPGSARMRGRAPDEYRVRLETSKGCVVVAVQRASAPHGADRFYNLVRSGFYDDQRFFRVRAAYIAQFGLSGDAAVTAAWKHQSIPDDPVRESNVRGTLAFAMTGVDTRATQVYINLADNSQLDAQGFAPFGRVIAGMDVVDRFYSGYGESAGGGMRGGKQGNIEAGGNAYLAREFPALDYIKMATLLSIR
jgi:cyclophilin family peptidyl-prolyl cis-trans isomerase